MIKKENSFESLQGLSLQEGSSSVQDLSGKWEMQIPTEKCGEWIEDASTMEMNLPGSLQTQNFGDDVSRATKWVGLIREPEWFAKPEYLKYGKEGSLKFPFWLQPEKHFIGAALYRREFYVPSEWAGKRLILTLERVHISSTLWLDGQSMGTCDSLSIPHRYELGEIAPGTHQILICVDNTPIPHIGANSHCVSDHTQTSWNGIVGEIKIEATPWTWIEEIQAYPNPQGRQVRLAWTCGGDIADASIDFVVTSPDGRTFAVTEPAVTGETVVPLGDAPVSWDEFSPQIYRLKAVLKNRQGQQHEFHSQFGMVEYRVEGNRFLVNGRPTIFRGTLECAVFPLTGYPSTDPDYWSMVFAQIKAHGLNHLRFHSWCPPEVAFKAADEAGCYLLVEHAWTAPAEAGEYLMAEAERVVKEYGNHPSFAMHSYGNEPTEGTEWLEEFVRHFLEKDPRRFYSGASGWPQLKTSQYHSLMDGLRVYPWKAGLSSIINAAPPATLADFSAKTKSENKPFISHETGQWCVYPDFDEIASYKGFLKAKNFEIFRDRLEQNHLSERFSDFFHASGRLQVLCYKYEIEMLLRTPDIGGYQLLGLNDFPGQGTALVGVVNPFWETKSYTSAAEYRRFSGPSVPLARLPKFVFDTSEVLTADLMLSHYDAKGLSAAVPVWKLVGRDGRILAKGCLPARDIPVGQSNLGEIAIPLDKVSSPCQAKLVVGIDGTSMENDWDVWIYPAMTASQDSEEVVITREPREAYEQASDGATVLLMPDTERIARPEGPEVVFGFSTIFWNTAWTRRHPPTTMGIHCDPTHPVFAAFPTDDFSNYQWWYLVKLVGRPLSLQGQALTLRPLVEVIDDWFTARRLGLVVEARCGKGRILISAIDLGKAAADDKVAAQFRTSLIGYMHSQAFHPKHELYAQDMNRLFTDDAGGN